MSVKFALLGAGRIGQVHARAISRVGAAELVAVYDPFDTAVAAVQDIARCDSRSVEDIEQAEDVDAVLICTPTDTHADLIECFARAGKAIFCEKPIDLDLDRVRACLRVVEECGAKLMVGFNRRFDPDFLAVKAAIDAGEVGDVEMVSITSRDPGPPPVDYIKRSGGMFRDMTIHDFDIARWLLGEDVDAVVATSSVLVDPAIGAAGDVDSANVILTTASGRQCTISNSRRAAYGYDQRIEVLGAQGAVAVENTHKSRIVVADAQGYKRPPLQDFFMTRYADAYAAEIEDFVAWLGGADIDLPSGQDGLMALALAEAAERSVKEKRVVQMLEILS